MDVAIFGLGYVGIAIACSIARDGHRVWGVDASEKRVRAVADGVPPISEPDVPELLAEGLAKGLIRATASPAEALATADMAIVCVGTPSAANGAHNMGFVAEVTRQIATALPEGRTRALTVAYRSTIRPGTTEELVEPIFRAVLGEARMEDVELVYSPAFLRKGSAVADYFAPPKIVIGTRDARPNWAMEELNRNLDAPTFHVGYRAAELTKFVDNTWHAVKVAYANEIGRVCLALGIEASTVHKIFVSDTKLNISPYYLRPGGAFGGSCLPKDVRALQHIAADCGANTHLVDSLLRSNEAHKHRLFDHARDGLMPGARVLLAGLAFKALTDDLRESPNVDLARKFLAAGFGLEIYDPAIDASKLVGANLGYAYSQLPTLERILVSRETAEARAEQGVYDRVIAANATVRDLRLPAGLPVVHTGTLA